MSEPIWCTVIVATPASWGTDEREIPGIDLIATGLINGECDPSGANDTNRPGVVHWCISGEGNYGLYDDLVAEGLGWLADHGVPYNASSEQKYDMTGEVDVFDGFTHFERLGDNDGNVMLPEHTYREIVKKWDHAPAGALAAIDAYFGVPDIRKINISHLPAICPAEDMEDA